MSSPPTNDGGGGNQENRKSIADRKRKKKGWIRGPKKPPPFVLGNLTLRQRKLLCPNPLVYEKPKKKAGAVQNMVLVAPWGETVVPPQTKKGSRGGKKRRRECGEVDKTM